MAICINQGSFFQPSQEKKNPKKQRGGSISFAYSLFDMCCLYSAMTSRNSLLRSHFFLRREPGARIVII